MGLSRTSSGSAARSNASDAAAPGRSLPSAGVRLLKSFNAAISAALALTPSDHRSEQDREALDMLAQEKATSLRRKGCQVSPCCNVGTAQHACCVHALAFAIKLS